MHRFVFFTKTWPTRFLSVLRSVVYSNRLGRFTCDGLAISNCYIYEAVPERMHSRPRPWYQEQ